MRADLTRKEKLKYLDLLREKAYRKRINPLSYCKLMPVQQAFCNDTAHIRGLYGGNRCLGGETKIYNPVTQTSLRVDEIQSDFFVWALDRDKLVVASASKPFKKDKDKIYRITLSSGKSFSASLSHVVLTQSGYKPLSLCSSGSYVYHPQTNLGSSRTVRVLNALHFWKTIQGFLSGCLICFRSCDALLLFLLNNDPHSFPSLTGVLERISFEAFVRKDVRENTPEHNRPCQSTVLPSSQNVLDQNGDQFFGTLFGASCKLYKSTLRLLLTVLLSTLVFFRLLSKFVSSLLGILFCYAMPSITSYSVITSILYLREDYKWDITVPLYGNYYASGSIHHNSGKSETVSKYVLDKCISESNQKWWMVSETFQDSVNILQKKVWELLPKTGMKYCKWNEVLGFTNKKIIFRNGSSIRFLSYEQGREAFQGDAVDGIVNDEEPPYDIYKEQRMRLIDKNGEMLFSMTSLRGMTELLMEIYDGANFVKTQKAPLLGGDEVPRVAEKNGIKFYFLWTTENKYINQERVVEETEFLTKQEIKCRMYGVPAGVALRIYPMFNTDVHVVKWKDVPDRQVSLYHVLDPHDRKPWAMQWWAVHKSGKKYCVWEYPMGRNFNEMEFDDKTYADYSEVIDEVEEGLLDVFGKRVEKRVIDPNFGNSTVTMAVRTQGQSKTTVKKELAKLGYKAGQKGAFIDGIDALATGHICVKKSLHWQERKGELVIAPEMYFVDHCTNSISQMTRYSFNDVVTAGGDIRDKVRPKDLNKDFPDCTRYLDTSNPKYIVYKEREKSTEKVY